jgi:colicin import membrane protein
MHRMTVRLAAAGIALAAVTAFAEEGRLMAAGLAKIAVADVGDLVAALRAQIFACWAPPVKPVRVNSPTVTVRITLNQDGSLSGEPVLVNSGNSPSQALAKSALLAVRRCQPFKLPAAKYELWQNVEITFDTRASPIPPR